MGIRTHLFIKCISIITALTTSSVACFSTPSATKEVNNEVLAIQLEQVENVAVINSNLLTESGQTILINGEFSEKSIPITISCENANFSKDTILTAAVTAVSSDESRMTVLLDKQEVVLDGTEQTVCLTINRSDYIALEDGSEGTTKGMPEDPVVERGTVIEEETVVEEEPPAGEEPATGEEPPIAEEPTDGPVYQLPSIEELKEEKELGIWELPVIITGVSSVVDKTDTIDTTEETPSEDEIESTLPEEGETSTEEEVPEEQPTDGETKVPGTEENLGDQEEIVPEDQEKPEEEYPEDETDTKDDESLEDEEIEETEIPLTVGVELTLGEKTFSATFVVDERDTEESAVGELKYCPSQYHPTGTLSLINNQEVATIVGDFPAMTKYTVGETSCILYDGGAIRVPAGENLKLDLSGTQMETDLTFNSFAGTAYTIKYVESPHELDDVKMIIVDGAEKILPISYQWGEITPVITIEHLTVGKEGLKWNLVENITCKDDGMGKIQMIPKGPEAGTYRINVLWIDNEITLYQLEIPFYVQYGSGDQGGSGQ